MHWILLGVAVVANATANISLKIAMTSKAGQSALAEPWLLVKQPALWAGLIAAAVLFVCYLLAIRSLHISIAYAIVTGMALVLTTVVSIWVFEARLAAVQFAGIGLVVLGVFLISANPGGQPT